MDRIGFFSDLITVGLGSTEIIEKLVGWWKGDKQAQDSEGGCQPCSPGSSVEKLSEKPLCSSQDELQLIVSESENMRTALDSISGDVNRLAEHFVRDAPDKAGNDKPQQPDWLLTLLGNIAIDVKRLADSSVGDNPGRSANGPVFQNLLDTVWLNNTLNGIQDNTRRALTLLPIQSNNSFNQTNNFTISGAQEPRAVAEAVRDSVPMMSDFSQANQILQARAI